MKTRYEVAKDLGFSESESNPGLLSWYMPGKNRTIFLDFRTKNDDGEWDGFTEDAPPNIYGSEDGDDDDDTEWLDEDEVGDFWAIEEIERQSGLDSDRGQTGLDWFQDDSIVMEECRMCGDEFEVPKMEDGLCLTEDTNGCYFEEHPSEMFRQAARRKERIRDTDG